MANDKRSLSHYISVCSCLLGFLLLSVLLVLTCGRPCFASGEAAFVALAVGDGDDVVSFASDGSSLDVETTSRDAFVHLVTNGSGVAHA